MRAAAPLLGLAAWILAFSAGWAATRPMFAPDLQARGAALAKLGDCMVCHTAPGGKPYAGGGAVPTPFGVVYGTNITPDLDTGIGRWSLADFDKALRRGTRRGGAPLYPAMPYDHYSALTAADVQALYAFMMTREPVRAAPPGNRLVPPLGFRPLLYIWKALFFHPAAPPPERGQYLVETLGHCGACHTPHGWLGDEQRAKALDGGWAEGWYAPPLNAASPASSAWTEDRLYLYLRTGLDPAHAAAAGPMGPVAHELAQAPEADVRAMAAYVSRQMQPAYARDQPPVIDQASAAAQRFPRGAQLFAGACAACHASDAPMILAGRPGLERGSPLWEADPRDTLKIMLDGLEPPTGAAGPYMPPFADAFRDDDLADLAGYMRARFTTRTAWADLGKAAAKARAAR